MPVTAFVAVLAETVVQVVPLSTLRWMLYPLIGAPPSLDGAVQLRPMRALPGVPVTPVGAVGRSADVRTFETLWPAALYAVTR